MECQDKPKLRQHFRAIRSKIPTETIRASSRQICERLAQWPPLRESKTVLAYLAFRNELDLSDLFERLPDIQWVAPRCSGNDLALIPGLAYDRTGGRLGQGGGYYDRFLPKTSALRIGITYDVCLVDELPCTEYDQHMDWIVTPTQTLICNPQMEEHL